MLDEFRFREIRVRERERENKSKKRTLFPDLLPLHGQINRFNKKIKTKKKLFQKIYSSFSPYYLNIYLGRIFKITDYD